MMKMFGQETLLFFSLAVKNEGFFSKEVGNGRTDQSGGVLSPRHPREARCEVIPPNGVVLPRLES